MSPRFTVEEVSSYEPVLFGKSLPTSEQKSPKLPQKSPKFAQKSPNSVSKSPSLARAVMTKQMVKTATSGKSGSVSPVLPKRHPVVNLRDQRSKSKEKPEIIVTLPSPTPSKTSGPGSSINSFRSESESGSETRDQPDVTEFNASSAFDNATFYV